jgi:uncharacterized membrane protein
MNTASSTSAKVATVLLSGLAAALAGLLLYQSQTQEALPGCGGGSDCDSVLSSRWSVWFGVPVSLMAMGLYTAMLAAVVVRDPKLKHPQRAAEFMMALCAVAAIAAALWFFSVQWFILGALCKYCLATHTAGVAASVLCLMVAWPSLPTKTLASATGGALLLVGGLIAGQALGDPPEAPAPLVQYAADQPTQPASAEALPQVPKDPLLAGPPPKNTHTTPAPTPSTANNNTTAKPAPDTPAEPRLVELYGGRVTIDISQLPIIGNPDAPNVMVILYDYTCSHCRDTKKMLEKTIKKHGDDLAIVHLPTPLNKKCNRLIKRYNSHTRYACDLAKTSLAVWRIAPQKWVEFDRMLYSNEEILTPVRAKLAAAKLVNEKELTRAMKDPWIDQRIARDVSVYANAARAGGKSSLPMLITEHGIMNGTPRHPLDIDDLIRGKASR